MVYNQYIRFEFDRAKSRSNEAKHGIDFQTAQELWNAPHFEFPLKTEGEPRWAVIGVISSVLWTAIITQRLGKVRIISVRRSRHEEKKIYQDYIGEKDPQ
jgi:uncharacterized DUF497 family protein